MNTRRQRERTEKEISEREDYRWLMSTASGRRIVWQLLSEAGVFRGSYAGEPNDTIFREGQRAIGLSLLGRIMRDCRDAFLTMLQEHEDRTDD